MQHDDLKQMRTLLTLYFTGEQLRQFCLDTPEFNPLYHRWDKTTSKAQIIDDLLEYAKLKRLIELLLEFLITGVPSSESTLILRSIDSIRNVVGRKDQQFATNTKKFEETLKRLRGESPPPVQSVTTLEAKIKDIPAEETVSENDDAFVEAGKDIHIDKIDLSDIVGERKSEKSAPALLRLRLDIAVPDKVEVRRAFDLAVAVRQLSSPVLAEDDLPQVKSGDVQISWSNSLPYVSLRVEVSAPDCEIDGEKSHSFHLYAGQDSPVFYFHLTPQKQGTISIIVTVYQKSDSLGSTRVHTVAYQEVVGVVQVDVTSHEITDSVEQRIINLTRRLEKLQEIKAFKGINTEPYILIEIEDIEKELEKLQEQRKIALSPAGEKQN